MQQTTSDKAGLLRRLHQGPELLVLPNAWDAISARIVEAEGFPVVATSSAGLAAVLGFPDGQRVPPSEMLFLIERIAASVQVPVSADVEAGYGDPVKTAHDLAACGVVGMNLEDMADGELIPLGEQLAAIRSIRSSSSVVINARTDIFLARHGDPETRFERAVERLNAFHDAGADCLFAPGVTDAETIARLTSALRGPLNILAGPGAPSLAEMKRLGVRRVSLGSGPSRVALGALRRFVRGLRDSGSLEALAGEAIPYPEIQTLLGRQ